MTTWKGKDGIVTVTTPDGLSVVEHGVNNFEITVHKLPDTTSNYMGVYTDFCLWLGATVMLLICKWDIGITNLLWLEAKFTVMYIAALIAVGLLAAGLKYLARKK